LRTARPSEQSTCSGNFIIWRKKYLRNSSAETNWLLENWGFVLEAIANNHQALIGGVDWITKKWLLEAFVESEGLSWDDPWLQSVDLEYHNIDPLRGLFFAVTPGKRIAEWNNNVRRSSATHVPPANTACVRSRSSGGLLPGLRFPLCYQLGFHRVR
jgi:proteasome accessory factor A